MTSFAKAIRPASIASVMLLGSLVQAEGIFPDKALEKAVRQYVFEKRNNEEPLTEKDVENISTIIFKGHTYTLDGKKVQREQKIKDLTGLEKCRSLRQLDLADHEISNLSPIAGLELLQYLDVANNRVQDIKPIAGLEKLQYLNLEHNQIENIGPLAGLKNMRSLYLTKNKIKDIASLASMTKAWSLYLGGNQISNIGPVANLKFLDTIDLGGNGLSDISALAGLKPAKHLFLDDNKIADISVLVAMAKKDLADPTQTSFAPFWNVYLKGNPLSEDARAKQLPELRKLSLDDRRPPEKKRVRFSRGRFDK